MWWMEVSKSDPSRILLKFQVANQFDAITAGELFWETNTWGAKYYNK